MISAYDFDAKAIAKKVHSSNTGVGKFNPALQGLNTDQLHFVQKEYIRRYHPEKYIDCFDTKSMYQHLSDDPLMIVLNNPQVWIHAWENASDAMLLNVFTPYWHVCTLINPMDYIVNSVYRKMNELAIQRLSILRQKGWSPEWLQAMGLGYLLYRKEQELWVSPKFEDEDYILGHTLMHEGDPKLMQHLQVTYPLTRGLLWVHNHTNEPLRPFGAWPLPKEWQHDDYMAYAALQASSKLQKYWTIDPHLEVPIPFILRDYIQQQNIALAINYTETLFRMLHTNAISVTMKSIYP